MSAMQTDFAAQRRNMVESQLRPNKITDEGVLCTMEQLPRELFVPPIAADISYIDEDIQVAPGRYLMEPMLLARMVQTAEIKRGDRVLEIGCGTGYGTALLANLSDYVSAIDTDSSLLAAAAANLRQLDLQASLTAAPLERGLPEQGPYDVMLVSGAVAEVPAAWGAQLADNGRMLVIIRADNGVAQTGVAKLYVKSGGVLVVHNLFDAQTPYLPGMTPRQSFTF